MAKKALGKGLGALIGRPESVAPAKEPAGGGDGGGGDLPGGERIRQLAVDALEPSPLQPRKVFNEGELEELVDSLRQHGVIQPLVVRSNGGKYELIAGERRWRAAQKLGLDEVPVLVREASDRDVLEMALIENLQRADLNPVEEAKAYVRLAKEFDLRQEDIAKRVGKNRATVANSMRLLDLEEDVLQQVGQGRLSVGHAKVLLQERDGDRQRLLAEQVIKQGLSVRHTERLVEGGGGGGGSRTKTSGKGKQVDAAVAEVTERIRERLGTKVTVHHNEKRGRIEIEYYGNDDLERLLALMGVKQDDVY